MFGFAQLVENAASPLTAFLIGPLAEVVLMPLMTDGAGADSIGGWFGTGPDRGIALLFTLAGLLGVAVTLLAWGSGSYRRLASRWPGDSSPPDGDEPGDRVAPVARLALGEDPAIAGEPT